MWENLIRNRPAVFAGLALAIGVAISPLLIGEMIGMVLSAVLLALVLLLSLRRWPALRLSLMFLAFGLLSALLTTSERESYRDTFIGRLATLKPEKAIIVGTLDNINETQSEVVWTVQTDSIGVASQQPIAARGAVLLRLSKLHRDSIPLPASGCKVKVFASLEPFHNATNPHEFAGELKLQTNTETETQGFIHSRYDYYVLSPPKRTLYSRAGDWLMSVHHSITALLDTAVTDTSSRGFVEAVVLGDRADMEKETLNDFTVAGVSHILAVSGFNVAIVSLVIAQLLRLFGVYWHRPRIIVTMIGVLAYSAIVGFQPSVVRALLMIELYLLAQLIERRPDPLNIIMGAAAVNLLLRPSDLFDVSFQLTYSAVLGLILITPQLRRLFASEVTETSNKRAKYKHQLVTGLAASLGASIASYPVIAAHFYRVSFVGLPANIPIIPLSALITALGFILIPITAVSTWFGQLYGEATAYLTKGLLFLTKLCAHIPGASHAAASPSWESIVYVNIVIIYCLQAATRKQFAGRLLLSLVSLCALMLLHAAFTDSVLDKNEGKLQVLFFDVGQGDCILIHTPSKKSYFVDFGTVSRNDNAVADRTALPFLRAENATNIEAGFISHMHLDHFGGAPTIVENCNVGEIFTSGERVSDSHARLLDRDTREHHVACHLLSRGDTLHLDSEVTLYVIHPDHHVLESSLTAYGQHINSGSLAFKLVYRNTSFLFLGDVERSEEEEMRESYGDFLHSNVVKVAHHGSLTSSSRDFVAATNLKYAVISVGEHNRFGHPAPAIVKRWMTEGAKVFRTDHDGAVLLASDGDKVTPVDWR